MSDLNKQQQQQQVAQQQLEQQQAQQVQQQQQTIQVQISHDASQQMHAQAQVVSSGATMIPTSTMVMSAPQQQTMLQQNMQNMQNMQSPPAIAPMPSHSGSTTITTMSTLGQQQQMADWGHGRVQVIQQPLQNPTYVQQVYNPQGQLLMPGNIALHPASMNQGSIQVIAAGKPFQPGQMPHMLTAQGKQLVQGQTASFPGYATIPTSGNNQTLVISQLGVQHLLPQQQQQQQQKTDMQKMMAKTNGGGGSMKVASSQQQNVTIGNQQQTISSQAGALLQPQIISPIQYTQQQRGVPQGATQAMQFAPWQPTFPTGLPQGLTWTPGALQSPTALLTTQGNQIFIRGPQPDQGMFHIHNPTQQAIPTHQSMQTQQMTKATQQVEMQPKAAIPKTFSNILPNSVGPQQIRPASSVSTQTAQTQGIMLASQKAGNKVRTKTVVSRNMLSMATQKSDAANQTKGGQVGQTLQPKMNGAQTAQMQQDKMMRVAHAQVQAQVQQQLAAVQQQLQQQQIQMFQQQIQPKPGPSAGQMMMQGQLVSSPGVDNRPVMPVVSLPPGVQSPLMAPMVVQNVEHVQGYQQQSMHMLASTIPMKADETNGKDDGVQQGGGMGSGPGRPENTPTSMETEVNASSPAQVVSNHEESVSEPSTESKPVTKDKENGNVERVEKTAPPKAMVAVKPQVLTHVIEGFVIQEASEPFAVNRGAMEHLPRTPAPAPSADEPPRKKPMIESPEKQLAKCEMCGKVDLKSKYKQSKRFCSLSCSKRYNVGCSARVGLFTDDADRKEAEAAEATGESSSPSSNGEASNAAEPMDETPAINPLKWTVAEVCDFIRGLPGCAEYVEDFAIQEIDGQALMLLKEDHLMSAMSIKLGPALKIVSKIDTMRIEPPSPSPKPS